MHINSISNTNFKGIIYLTVKSAAFYSDGPKSIANYYPFKNETPEQIERGKKYCIDYLTKRFPEEGEHFEWHVKERLPYRGNDNFIKFHYIYPNKPSRYYEEPDEPVKD